MKRVVGDPFKEGTEQGPQVNWIRWFKVPILNLIIRSLMFDNDLCICYLFG